MLIFHWSLLCSCPLIYLNEQARLREVNACVEKGRRKTESLKNDVIMRDDDVENAWRRMENLEQRDETATSARR